MLVEVLTFQSCTTKDPESSAHEKKTHGGTKILARVLTRIRSSTFTLKPQPIRGCFHPGASVLSRETIHLKKSGTVTGQEMIMAMLQYIWPADDKAIKERVTLAVGLLVGAKMMNVAVPFIFKYAVDYLNFGNTLNMNSAPETIVTVATSILVGCKESGFLASSKLMTSVIRWDCTCRCCRFQRVTKCRVCEGCTEIDKKDCEKCVRSFTQFGFIISSEQANW